MADIYIEKAYRAPEEGYGGKGLGSTRSAGERRRDDEAREEGEGKPSALGEGRRVKQKRR